MNFGIMLDSLFSSDIMILIWAILTLGVMIFTGVCTYKLWKSLHTIERKANPEGKQKTADDENRILRKQLWMNIAHTCYANFTAIFPLWGMLGTVWALIGLAGRMNEAGADVEQFFNALTSTAWGIIFAIGFKCIDSVISVYVDANNKEVDTLLDRNSSHRKEQEREASHENQRDHT